MSRFDKRSNRSTHYGKQDPTIKRYTSLIGKRKGKKIKIKENISKKEKEEIRGGCVHHMYNDKGRLKTTAVYNSTDGVMYCWACDSTTIPDFYGKEEMKAIIKEFTDLNNNMKFLAVGINGGPDTIKFFSDMGRNIVVYKRLAKKVTNVAVKKDRLGNKSKNKGNKKKDNSSNLGGWKF